MLFFKLIAAIAATTAVFAAPTSNHTAIAAEAADCPKASRYACGQYMLRDGTRQDFVSQVYKCIPRDQFMCNIFKYEQFDPNHPNAPDRMIAAKVDPGCTCTFYSYACDGAQYTETLVGWEGEPNKPEWSRPMHTDKFFVGWWCKEDY
ncbi:hypothetical protein HBI24_000770 [Parastagonospora nodorum]|nr:hypothetical protein HBI76_114920 [Parastagonospora nodorum]KAH5073551.1 hypothetical protein HBH95_153700 [Parastagonospora nodorum]KAH5595198.1 hypothetical protein HBI24_000770 [Parastagonospora nodorum]KAH5743759.1 hypothetical protein HBI18_019430 [Parastagonospora nodorum]KAH6313863.1 hypothetical protein HBI39_049910 [Parastagonospora nodorum]